ncbi:MAG TPA: ABC transporter substrate-binding protein [Burkholderiaceae bacterium]|nr:ABC transporter substrate-binding protein [Burkholderiaceae bacterium]
MRRLKVAVVGPFSGPRSAYGALIREALAASAGRPGLQLQLWDDAALPAAARRVAGAIRNAGVDAVVGHFNSDCAHAAGAIYRNAGIPLLLPASTAMGLADGRHVFRLCGTEGQQADAMVRLLRTELASWAPAVWSDGSPYARRLRARLESASGAPLLSVGAAGDTVDERDRAIVYLGSHVAVMQRMREEAPDHAAARVCCDDCWIEEFRQAAHQGTFICAPHAGYGELLQGALAIIERVMLTRQAEWADFFDDAGESREAGFRIQKLARAGHEPVVVEPLRPTPALQG